MDVPFPEADLRIQGVEYYSMSTTVGYARSYSGYERIFNTHLPVSNMVVKSISYYQGHQVHTLAGQAKVLGELVKGLPRLPDDITEMSAARYGRYCYNQAVQDEAEKHKTVIDLNEESIKSVHDAFLKKFGPLPKHMMMNDIIFDVLELIKAAPIKES